MQSSARRVVRTVFMALALLCSDLAAREAWTTSEVSGSPDPPLPYRVASAFGGRLFDRPVTFTNAPGTDSMFLVELPGRVYELPNEDSKEARQIIDFTKYDPKITNVYGFAFHPQFPTNHEIYVCYTRSGDIKNGTVLSRFRLNAETLALDDTSEFQLLTWRSGGHNGGCVKFGPDGYLYVSAGDAAAPFPPDPLLAGQDLTNLLSTVFRIDVDRRAPGLNYAIPDDNPFLDVPGARKEIWAYGFRNPWRMAFDAKTGDLWLGDVGWELWEMIHHVQRGGNYGWSIMEGPHVVNADAPRGPTPIQRPAAVHSHAEARSITGGQVYYGTRLPELRGSYVYGDHATGIIWAIRKEGKSYSQPQVLARTSLHIICFGTNNQHELFVVDYSGGIYRLEHNPAVETNTFPKRLSQSGIFASTHNHELADGVIAYSVNAAPWMDGATAHRFVGIPDSKTIGVYGAVSAQEIWNGQRRGDWKFPKDSVLGRTIELNGQRIETQLLHFDGRTWNPYTFVWNDDQTDAVLAADKAIQVPIKNHALKRTWQISSRSQCMVCHSSAVGMVIGFKPEQLQGVVIDGVDQLDLLNQLGIFERSPHANRQLVDPCDSTQRLEDRVRSYLHVNCSHCHRRDGGGAVPMDTRYELPTERTHIINQAPTQGDFGIKSSAVVAPGHPFQSILYYRLMKLGPGHMPRLGSTEVDSQATQLVFDWILSLAPTEKTAADQWISRCKTTIASTEDPNQIVQFLSDSQVGLATAHAIETDQLDQVAIRRILQITHLLPENTRGLFERFLPEDQRTVRLGNAFDPQIVLSQQGNADEGRKLFMSDTVACKSCHPIEPGKTGIGPNLSSLSVERYDRPKLLQSIVSPSSSVEPKYATSLIETVDGLTFTGIIQQDSPTLILVDAKGVRHEFSRDEIESRRELQQSIMPDGLINSLTPNQAADLLEFLHSLGSQPNR